MRLYIVGRVGAAAAPALAAPVARRSRGEHPSCLAFNYPLSSSTSCQFALLGIHLLMTISMVRRAVQPLGDFLKDTLCRGSNRH